NASPLKYATCKSSHGVNCSCPRNDASGSSRLSMIVPSRRLISTRLGSKNDRLSWPGKSPVTRSLFVSTSKITFFKYSGLLLTFHISPVPEAATVTAATLPQRSNPPCASTTKSNRSFIAHSSQYSYYASSLHQGDQRLSFFDDIRSELRRVIAADILRRMRC